jgi:pimeloyl-ACP methyl ester carboxylesterase
MEQHGPHLAVGVDTYLCEAVCRLAAERVAEQAAGGACIVAPTLYINGELDIMTPVDMGPSGLGMRRMAELTPNGVLDIIEGCGHLILGEAAEEASARIVRFLLDG